MRRATACFSMYSDMSMRTMAASSSKRNSARARAVSVLPTPVGPRKMKLPMGCLGSLRPARLRRMALATTVSAASWPTTRWRSRSSICDQLLHLAFEHLGDGDSGPARDDLGDVFFVDLFLQHAVRALPSLSGRLGELTQFRFGLGDFAISAIQPRAADCPCASAPQLRSAGLPDLLFSSAMLPIAPRSVCQRARRPLAFSRTSASSLLHCSEALLERLVFLALESGLLDFEVSGLAFEVVDLGGDGADLVGQRGGGFVDQVDGLVGQEAVGDVAVRERGRGDDGGVLDAHLVVRLVALAQAAQDGDGVLDVWLADVDDLEAALERGILLYIFAVLVQRGCADGAQAAAGQRRLQHVAGVHRSFGRAGADQGVQLVDEQYDFAVGVFDLLQQRLQAIFELAAILGAGDHAGQVERDDALVLEDLGDVAVDDAAGQAFDDGGLANAGLADQHGVVLRPAREHLDHAANLLVAADDGIELALAREVGQVFAVLLQRLELGFGVLVGDALRAAHGRRAP